MIRNRRKIQYLTTISLAILMILSCLRIESFKDIFAENNDENIEFTWRETTAERVLYWDQSDYDNIGKKYMGETFEEVLQMAQDPSVEFDEENFWNGTIFEGCTTGDIEALVDMEYTKEDLINLLIEEDYPTVIDYFNSLYGLYSMYDVNAVADTEYSSLKAGYFGDGQVKVYIPSLERKTDDGKRKPFYYLHLDYEPAFCLDNGLHMPDGTTYFYQDEYNESYAIQAINWYYGNHGPGYFDASRYEYAQMYIWANGDLDVFQHAMAELYISKIDSEYTYEQVAEKANSYLSQGFNNHTQGIWRTLTGESTEPNEGLQPYWYSSYNSENQRLITVKRKDNPPPDPPPLKEVKDSDFFRNRLYVQHNITGTISDNGKGVIGNWMGLTNNPTLKVCVCGNNNVTYTNTNCSHNIFTKDFYETLMSNDGTGSEHLTSLGNHNYTSGPSVYWTAPTFHPSPWSSYYASYGYWTQTASWQTYNEHYCEPNKQHTINPPTVENYTLTLHYQGGWYNGTADTQSMNGQTYNLTHANTHRNGVTSDLTTTETTKVAFTGMSIVGSYELNAFSATTRGSAGSLEMNGLTGTFKHSNVDGVSSLIEFKYKNYYIVSLPVPSRVSYNFLGWYDSPSGGTKVEPSTITVDGITFNNAYVIKQDTTLYAHWELITKDEDITVHWLDNSNNYTTRPEAIYVELYRYTDTGDVELCEGYITEKLNTSTADWITRFSNETGITSDGNPTGGYKTNGIFDPNQKIYNYSNNTTSNNVNNNIFAYGSTYLLKISGDNLVPAGSNTWTVTLKDLQKFDTYDPGWKEYTYVVKAIIVESLDETVQYFTSSNINYNNYNISMDKYYMTKEINENPYLKAESNQGTYAQYNSLSIKNYFTKTIVNRAANVAGPTSWKDIEVTITFEDGPQNEVTSGTNSYDDDIYHFRPYGIKVELYQNLPYGIDESSNNFLSNTGVRKLYKTIFVTHNNNNPWSSTSSTDSFGIRTESKSLNGILANKLQVTFKNVPTLQDNTCIKIAYDVIISHGDTKYRYTIDNNDDNNNLSDEFASSHYYANKHETNIKSPMDLNYTKMYNKSDNTYITILPYTESNYKAINASEINTYALKGYEFVVDNSNDIYQNYLQQEDDNHIIIGQNNVYENYTGNAYGPGATAYPEAYKSMGYNFRYYYTSETNNLIATPRYVENRYGIANKEIEYLFYKETLHWYFTLTLNHEKTPLPEEYSGSNSEDDRTGNYNGTSNDDFTHTNNKITITNTIYNDKNHTTNATLDDYNNLIINPDHEDFLITFKQVEKIWNNSGHDVTESYNNNKYSTNGYMYINNTSSGTKVTYKSNTTPIANSINMGNDYNILVPANGTVVIDYLPDGKYEITCHYDIDFDSFDFTFSGSKGTAKFTEENGKHYLTLSSVDVKTEGTVNHMATIDYWRGYVDDENNNANSANNTISNLNYKSSMN